MAAKKLRITTFLESYLQPTQTFVYRQMNSLTGCEVRFLARYRAEGSTYPEVNCQFFGVRPKEPRGLVRWRLHRLRQLVTGRYCFLGRGERLRLTSLLLDHRPHLIHAHWAPDAMLVAGLCKSLKIPLVVHFHGYDASQLLADPIYVKSLRRLFGQMAVGITVSDDQKSRLLRKGFPSDKVVRHYTGVPNSYFGEMATPPRHGERLVFLQVGRLSPVKGHRTTLEAFAAFARRRPSCRLLVVGEGPLLAELQRMTRRLGLEGVVEFLGHMSADAARRQMQTAHALLAPSETAEDGRAEGLPNVVVEALAVGLPVVATLHAGIPEAVRYSEAGWLVAERDVAALERRLERLVAEKGLWEALSREGRDIARTDFHLPTQNARLEDLYARLIARPHSPVAPDSSRK
jgi:glycosyltransferase involved in cell wall biosynthesis